MSLLLRVVQLEAAVVEDQGIIADLRARIAELEAAQRAWEQTGPESEKRIAELEAEVAALEKAGDAMAEQAAWFSLTLCLKGTIRETEIAEALDAWLAASGGSGK